jgi:signal transduction histidine kinase
MVILATWSPETGVIRSRSSAGYGSTAAQRARRSIKRLLPGFNPEDVTMDVHVNAVQEAVFLRGESVTGPFLEIAKGVVPEVVLRIVSKLLNVRFSTVHPLWVRGQVVGSLSFHGEALPSQAVVHAYEAFTKQAALTIENTTLLETLREQMEELRETRRMVSAANEAVRREIAETLHGPVQTQLLVADFTLSQASALVEGAPEEAKRAIADARTRIEDVRERDIREVSHLLHPSVIKLGLAPAIRSLAGRFQSMMDVRLDIASGLDGVGSKSEVSVDMDTRLVAYRVIEEAFSNARKHGAADSVAAAVRLSGANDLLITVRDDGAGLPPGRVIPGLGLQMVAMKVQDADGAWSLKSNDDQGATLTVMLPLTGAGIGSRVLAGPLPELEHIKA